MGPWAPRLWSPYPKRRVLRGCYCFQVWKILACQFGTTIGSEPCARFILRQFDTMHARFRALKTAHRLEVFDQRFFQLGGSSKAYRVYFQSTTAIASGLVVMEVEFMDFYSSATQWTNLRKTATAAIASRSGNTDWSQYIEVKGVNPPQDCAVRVRLFCSCFSASQFLYTDPKVVVS